MQRKVNIEKHEPILGEMSIEYSDVFNVGLDANRILKQMSLRNWEEMSKEEFIKAFSHDLASLWKVHCFREGNTRTVITFCIQFADEKGFPLNRNLFEKHSEYVRTALVAYNAYFSDGIDVSKKEYLENFIADALN